VEFQLPGKPSNNSKLEGMVEDYKSQARDEYSSKPDPEKLRKMLPGLRVKRTNAAGVKLRKGDKDVG